MALNPFQSWGLWSGMVGAVAGASAGYSMTDGGLAGGLAGAAGFSIGGALGALGGGWGRFAAGKAMATKRLGERGGKMYAKLNSNKAANAIGEGMVNFWDDILF